MLTFAATAAATHVIGVETSVAIHKSAIISIVEIPVTFVVVCVFPVAPKVVKSRAGGNVSDDRKLFLFGHEVQNRMHLPVTTGNV